jgi:hypothetical protein
MRRSRPADAELVVHQRACPSRRGFASHDLVGLEPHNRSLELIGGHASTQALDLAKAHIQRLLGSLGRCARIQRHVSDISSGSVTRTHAVAQRTLLANLREQSPAGRTAEHADAQPFDHRLRIALRRSVPRHRKMNLRSRLFDVRCSAHRQLKRFRFGCGSAPACQQPVQLRSQRVSVDCACRAQDGRLRPHVFGPVRAQVVDGCAFQRFAPAVPVPVERRSKLPLAQSQHHQLLRIVIETFERLKTQASHGGKRLGRQLWRADHVDKQRQGIGQARPQHGGVDPQVV